MCIEIETKLKIESNKRVEEKLAQLGAEFLVEQLQTDYYFDDEDRTLTAGDKCLRVRRVLTGNTEKIFLTYKGPREKHNLKKRREIETQIHGRDSMQKILAALGYQEVLVFEKKRRLWRLDECEVALDELPLLGSFVEIEGPDANKITQAQKRLGLEHLPHILESYASLVAEKLPRQSYG